MSDFTAIRWADADCALVLLDQRLLPAEEAYLTVRSADETAAAIRDLVVRGAPAIGITAAFGVVLSAMQHVDARDWRERIAADMETLRQSRPTAVNLFWALDRMSALLSQLDSPDGGRLLAEAQKIHAEDIEANRKIGQFGAELIDAGTSVLTHCNTGSLATGGFGTALGVIRAASQAGKLNRVFAGETRPWLQGARLTAWELLQDGIPVDLVIEGAVASLFRNGLAQWLVVGADRIVANGDTANKIGTYSAACHARAHGARVMVAAPASTVDLNIATGDGIPIEHRAAGEVLSLGQQSVAAAGAGAWNPVFDVTPAELIDAIVTEKGIARPPFEENLPKIV